MGNIRLRYIDTRNFFGTMNTGTIRLSNLTDKDKDMIMEMHNLYTLEGYELTKEDKSAIFRAHRKLAGEDLGFDWHKMFMADQGNFTDPKKVIKDYGSVFKITPEYVEANPNGWTDIPEDILQISKDVPGVAAGHPVADCPIIVVEDLRRGVSNVFHSGGAMIDKYLPLLGVEVLRSEGSNLDDLRVFVGAKAGPGWVYTDNPPAWANDPKVWEETGAIIPGKMETANGVVDTYQIDLEKALRDQFRSAGLSEEQVKYDPHDTISDLRYYSNSQGYKDASRIGRQFAGAIYQEEGHGKSR